MAGKKKDEYPGYKELKAKIQGHLVRGVYLFFGEEENRKQQAWNELRAAVLPAGLEALNEDVMEAPAADALIAACETLPLMGERRLVTVRDQAGLAGKAEPEDKLLDYLARLPETTVLVFYHIGDANGTRKLFKAIKKAGEIYCFRPANEAELRDEVIGRFREAGHPCTGQTASAFIFTVGTDTGVLKTEIDKLSAYVPEGEEITRAHIDACATPSLESSVFGLVDDVVAGRPTEAFRRLSLLRLAGTDDVMILYMLLRQFRLMRMLKILQHEKRPAAEMPGTLGLQDFAFQRLLRQGAAWGGRQVRDAMALCLDTEAALKGGRIPAEGAADVLMDKLFALAGGK